MTTETAKEAFRRGVPVIYGGIEYREITALITRKDMKARKYILQLELMDYCGHAVVIAAPEKTELAAPLEVKKVE